MRAGGAAWLAARYVVALAALAVFLFPLYWLLVTALKTPAEVLTYPPVWWPAAPRLDNLAALLEGPSVRAIANSLTVAALSTALAVALGTAAAVALARAGLGGTLLAGWAVGARMASPVMVALPFALLLPALGLAEGLATLVLLLAAFNLPYALWMMRGYFRDVPIALQETALVAGLTRDQVFARVVWPAARGGLIATAAFTFLLAWNELAFALVLAPQAAATIPVLLAGYGERPEQFGEIAALAVAGALPAPIALALMHRRLARSLSLGVVRD